MSFQKCKDSYDSLYRNKKQIQMREYKKNSETIIEVDSLDEALNIDTEMKDVNIIIVNNVSTQGNWKEAHEQNHIPKEISENPQNFGKIIIRVGLGYHYFYDTLDKSWVKPVDTDTRSVIKKYLKEK